MPCHSHAFTMPLPYRAELWLWEVVLRTAWSWHGTGAAWAWHGMCGSNTAALCKSNVKTQTKPLAERHGRRTAWQENGMSWVNKTLPQCANQMGKTQTKTLSGTAWARHGMCELAFTAYTCTSICPYPEPAYHRNDPTHSPCKMFHNTTCFYDKDWLAPRPNPYRLFAPAYSI
jgi:hypothetical protein